jgi:hypothetical protein
MGKMPCCHRCLLLLHSTTPRRPARLEADGQYRVWPPPPAEEWHAGAERPSLVYLCLGCYEDEFDGVVPA